MNWAENKNRIQAVGIIGAGYAAGVHAAALKKIDDTIEQFVYDINTVNAERISAEHGCKVSVTLDELFDSVDAVILASPVWTHHKLVLNAVQRGKHILCEKPMSESSLEAKEMYSLSENENLVCAIGFNYRFFDITDCLRREIEDERIREINISIRRLFRSDWKRDEIGVLSDLGIHLIDLLTCLSKSRISLDTCSIRSQYINTCDYDTKVNGYLENNTAFTLEAARIDNADDVCFCLEVICEKRTIQYDSRQRDCYKVMDREGLHLKKIEKKTETEDFFDFSDSIFRQDENWIKSISGEATPESASFRDGWQAQIVLESLLQKN